MSRRSAPRLAFLNTRGLGNPLRVSRRVGSRHLGSAARWPLGLLLTWWAYTWRITPLHRSEQEGDPERDGPPPLPPGVPLDAVQKPEDGHGPLLRRRYRVDVCDPELDAARVMAAIREDPNRVVPGGLARFHREGDAEGPLSEG